MKLPLTSYTHAYQKQVQTKFPNDKMTLETFYILYNHQRIFVIPLTTNFSRSRHM